MADKVIRVDNLSKRYRLGLREKQAKTITGQVINLVKSPWENFKRLREMSRFGIEDESVFWALIDVNFEVKEGEVLGIIGKNGAGKSTLLKILSQITEPTSGRIEIHGRVASLLEVGTGFHPELSGRENIYMNGTILGMTRREIDSKLDEIVDFSGIEKFLDTPVKFYSSGMKVRLGFSVAAHLEPEILIIDEVLAVGDYEFQRKCLGKMEDVSKNQGRTVLFVSHNLEAVKDLCPRSILIEKGKVNYEGVTDQVLNMYRNIGQKSNYLDIAMSGIKGKGNKNIQLLEISLSSTLNSMDDLVTHSPLFLKLKFKNNLISNLLKAKVHIRIDNAFNQRILWMSSEANRNFDFSREEIIFKLDRNPLLPGDYVLTVYIHDGVDVADWFPSVITFSVSSNERLHKEFKIPSDQSNIFVPYEVI
jgi:lipopolysaccharide transport system ATP-binding protein